MVGIIGGTLLLGSSIFDHWEEKTVETSYGLVKLKAKEDVVFLQRHGDDSPVPPHRINHRANIWALYSLGVRKIVSINSVGSLKLSIKPGTFVVPHDFISLWDIPTFFETEMRFTVPLMDGNWSSQICRIARNVGMKVIHGGIYIQTRGPRLETKAEITMLKRFGDIVGMTMGSEATLALEMEISYASLCSVDNYCNGISSSPLTMEEIKRHMEKSLGKVESFIERLWKLEKDNEYSA